MRLLLAIDLGTGSCRAVLFAEDGRQVAIGQREWTHPALPGYPGSQVFETERNWQLICDCIREALDRAGATPADVAAVSSTSMREGMVLYDADGREIWACPNVDSRAADEAAALVRSGAARRIFETAGDWVAITSPARFLWIREHQPEVFRAIAHVGMLSDWVLYRLTGRFVTDPTAGSSSDLFDLRARTWSPALLELIGLDRSIVPEVLEPGSVVGPLTGRAADETGLAAGTPVVVGGADTQLGLVGIGVVRPDRLTLVGGSFWQLTAVTDAPLIDPQARVRTLCHAIPGQWMTEGIGFYCGIAMRWYRDAFCELETAEAARRGVDPYVVMEEAAARVPAGSDGVVAIFSNVMDVKRWVQASPSFLQFDVDHPAVANRIACIRAIEEQAAYASRGHLRIIEELTGRTYDEIVFTGGAAKGRLWPQIVADVLGVSVRVPAIKESTALGAAIYAGLGVGIYDTLGEVVDQLVRFERTVDPDPVARDAYDGHFARWRDLYPRILGLSEAGLLRPMWWPAGADAASPEPVRPARKDPSAMPEADSTETKQFHEDVPQRSDVFFLKGSAAYDWGMQQRLARIFRPESGRTVMLAIDHGYFQGPTTGLERVDLNIVPLIPYADALMLTRGILRTVVPPTIQQGFVLRASGGPSILKELSNEQLALDADDAVRLGAAAMAVQVFVGGEFETQSVHNMTRLVDEGYRRGIPVLGVTAVGKELVRDARYLGLATRICAELGAQVVKTYYCEENFERVTAGCPVPVVMAGGKKLPELDALTMARRAIDGGAAGVDMGRNIFQSDAPIAMLQAVRKVVHDGVSPAEAYDVYRALRGEFARPAAV